MDDAGHCEVAGHVSGVPSAPAVPAIWLPPLARSPAPPPLAPPCPPAPALDIPALEPSIRSSTTSAGSHPDAASTAHESTLDMVHAGLMECLGGRKAARPSSAAGSTHSARKPARIEAKAERGKVPARRSAVRLFAR